MPSCPGWTPALRASCLSLLECRIPPHLGLLTFWTQGFTQVARVVLIHHPPASASRGSGDDLAGLLRGTLKPPQAVQPQFTQGASAGSVSWASATGRNGPTQAGLQSQKFFYLADLGAQRPRWAGWGARGSGPGEGYRATRNRGGAGGGGGEWGLWVLKPRPQWPMLLPPGPAF